MKASYKMKKAIEKLESKYGKMNQNFGVELIESNRTGKDFYDFCNCHCTILQKTWTIAHDGTITPAI